LEKEGRCHSGNISEASDKIFKEFHHWKVDCRARYLYETHLTQLTSSCKAHSTLCWSHLWSQKVVCTSSWQISTQKECQAKDEMPACLLKALAGEVTPVIHQSDVPVTEYWLATESLERGVDHTSVQKWCSLRSS